MSYGSLITCSLISSSTCDSPVIDQPPVIVANPFVPRLSPHIHAHLLPKLSSSISALTDGSKLLGAKSELDHATGSPSPTLKLISLRSPSFHHHPSHLVAVPESNHTNHNLVTFLTSTTATSSHPIVYHATRSILRRLGGPHLCHARHGGQRSSQCRGLGQEAKQVSIVGLTLLDT
jgi:hypothetical protein